MSICYCLLFALVNYPNSERLACMFCQALARVWPTMLIMVDHDRHWQEIVPINE